ncbi:MAG: metallophosphoesterase [Gemmatimonadaceae bacterium]
MRLAGASVLMGAGDIARCGTLGDEGTAAIVDSLLVVDSIAKVDDAVLTLGDNVYESGTAREFATCFAPSWGKPGGRIMRKIHPIAGNHEYETNNAAPYFSYFGDRAGPSGKGYYSFEMGAWHVVALNSELPANFSLGPAAREQEVWLKKDLQDHPAKCTLAYFHRPLFSSSFHGTDATVRPLFQILFDGNVDLLLVGHDHTYERFAPQTPNAVLDTLRGITQIVVGTGGGILRGFRSPSPNSLARVEGYYGIFKLTLGAGAFQHVFIDTHGRIWDPGSGKCH